MCFALTFPSAEHTRDGLGAFRRRRGEERFVPNDQSSAEDFSKRLKRLLQERKRSTSTKSRGSKQGSSDLRPASFPARDFLSFQAPESGSIYPV